MSTVLKLTLATGEVHEVPFYASSTLTIATRVQGGADIIRSHTDIVDVQLLDVADDSYSVDGVEPGMLTSPETAIVHAKSLPLADAAAHVERARLKFPDDDRLAQVQSDLHNAVQNGQETWSTSVEVEELDPFEVDGLEPDPEAWLDNPAAAVAYINQLGTIEDAEVAIAFALERFPVHTELLGLKEQVERIRDEQNPPTPEKTESKKGK